MLVYTFAFVPQRFFLDAGLPCRRVSRPSKKPIGTSAEATSGVKRAQPEEKHGPPNYNLNKQQRGVM